MLQSEVTEMIREDSKVKGSQSGKALLRHLVSIGDVVPITESAAVRGKFGGQSVLDLAEWCVCLRVPIPACHLIPLVFMFLSPTNKVTHFLFAGLSTERWGSRTPS
jgi:hypothetical protein